MNVMSVRQIESDEEGQGRRLGEVDIMCKTLKNSTTQIEFDNSIGTVPKGKNTN